MTNACSFFIPYVPVFLIVHSSFYLLMKSCGSCSMDCLAGVVVGFVSLVSCPIHSRFHNLQWENQQPG
ncbi:hypothetical protein JB92DRAFT_3143862 [Gautieria morchelliformis]|nr:hypothetical protein JB92DRAFT_3143862 [Gautieria morchelliformis]